MCYFLKLINFNLFLVAPLKLQSWFLTLSNIVLCWRIFWNPSSFPIAFFENFKDSSLVHTFMGQIVLCVYVNFVSIGVYVNFTIDSFFTYPKTSNKKGYVQEYSVLINYLFNESFYKEKNIWIIFLFFIKFVLKVF